MKFKAVLSLLLLAVINLNALEIGTKPKSITISGENGGMAKDGSPWNSDSLKENLFVMFYVDPDEKDMNEHYTKALKQFKKENNMHFQSIAIVNLAATWKPNFVIEALLKSKQKEFPDTIYVKDKNKILVKAWGVGDDTSNIIIFNKDGQVLFYKSGKMSDKDIKESFKIIKENM
jgi:predicted transcriptional regulator